MFMAQLRRSEQDKAREVLRRGAYKEVCNPSETSATQYCEVYTQLNLKGD